MKRKYVKFLLATKRESYEKNWGLLVLFSMFLAVLLMPAVSLAAGQKGIYVAPKFVLGLTEANATKLRWASATSSQFAGGRAFAQKCVNKT